MQTAPSARYTIVAIILHWMMAALILFMIVLGWNMEDHAARLQLHKSIGITLLFLTVTRVLWRVKNPVPPMPETYSTFEVVLARLVHLAFYVLMLLVPFSGWILVSISESRVPMELFGSISWPFLPLPGFLHSQFVYGGVEFFHSKGAWGFIILLVLHVAGALKHEISDEEGVLKRMLPGLFGIVLAPRTRARGYGLAIGGVLLVFSLIAFMTGSARLAARDVARPVKSVLAEPLLVGNWDVDYETSEIRFSGVYDGSDFTGVFRNWSAIVAFYPDDLQSSEVRVTIDMTSADAGRKLYNESLLGVEWFDTSTFPESTVRLSNFRETDDGYVAEARIRLKTVNFMVPLYFTLDIQGDRATLSGNAVVNRKDLNLGQVSDPAGLWVSEDINITVSGTATRKNVTQK